MRSFFFLFLFCVLGVVCGVAGDGVKVGLVDVSRVMGMMKKIDDGDATGLGRLAELNQKRDAARKRYLELSDVGALSEDKRKELLAVSKQVADISKEIADLTASRSQKYQETRTKVVADFRSRMVAAVAKVAKANGYSVVLNAVAQGEPVTLFLESGGDVTDLVLLEMGLPLKADKPVETKSADR